MKIDFPIEENIPQIRELWIRSFGETDFWNRFFDGVFQADHCRCLSVDGRAVAALYWFDCSLEEEKTAYLYAVATAEEFRNRGMCRTLLEDTNRYLGERGYSGTLLVPENDSLRTMYRRMGYENCGGIREFTCEAGKEKKAVWEINLSEYVKLRENLLPGKGIIQGENNLCYLNSFARMWAGEDFVLAGNMEKGRLNAWELLGNAQAAPGILAALSCMEGRFRTPGTDDAFAMWHPLRESTSRPEYFGLAFD